MDMKITRKRVFVSAVLSVLAIVVLFVLFALASIPKPSLGTLVERLESQEIQLGHSDDVDWSARSIVEFSTKHYSGDTYLVRIYYKSGIFVTLYSENGILFAAQYAQGMVGESKIKWYFLDDDKLAKFNSIVR